MKAYRGVDPLDFLAETGKRIIYRCYDLAVKDGVFW